MNSIFLCKLGGLERELKEFSERLNEFKPGQDSLLKLTNMIESEMLVLGFNEVKTDDVGNVTGVVKGYGNHGDILLLSNIDLPAETNNIKPGSIHVDSGLFKNDIAGLITSIYTGALLIRSLTVLKGNVIVACITRSEYCGFGVKQLFKELLKNRNISGVILSEPTDFQVYLGNKGRLEYEIVVNDLPTKSKEAGLAKTVFSDENLLLNRLHEISYHFPTDKELGRSTLVVKNVHHKDIFAGSDHGEIHVQMDRTFIPGENEDVILQNAKNVADEVFNKRHAIVDTHISEDLITTFSGKMLKEVKEYKPWKMEGYHPFVVDSLNVLNENGFKSEGGYWKNRITEGSYTNGVLKIPTIGFGAGKDESTEGLSLKELRKSIFGKALIINRHIGVPTFGWTDDEI